MTDKFLKLTNGAITEGLVPSGSLLFSAADRIGASIGGGDVAPHNMTAPSTPSPYVVSESTYYPGYQGWKAFDNSSGSTFWSTATGNPTGWLKIDLGSAKSLQSYSIQMANDTSSRQPKNWTLEGSDNGTDWTTVDSRTNITSWTYPETKNFTMGSPSAAYRYWRLNISANNGDPNYVEAGEVYLNSPDTLTGTEISCTPAARGLLDDATASAMRTTLGLGNVTNDAQLKRADGDMNSFTEKTSPANNDILLIEDSAASYAKKKVKVSNLPTGALAGWSIITSNPNPAQAGSRYMANTSGGAFTITLPASPSANQRIVISDYAGTFETYNLTVGRNGNKIMGLSEDLILNLPDVTVTLDYLDATQGWRIV